MRRFFHVKRWHRAFSTSTLGPESYARAVALIDSPRTPETMREARAHLQHAAQAQHPAALGRLGRWAMFGLFDEPQDPRTGLRHLQQAALLGDAQAAYWLGSSFLRLQDFAPKGCGGAAAAAAAAASAVSAAPTAAATTSDTASAAAAESPAVPDPFAAVSEDAAAARAEAAKGVVEEIKAMRRAALAARRSKGASVLADAKAAAAAAAASPAASLDSLYTEDLSTLPLVRSSARAYAWLKRAALGGSSMAAVALGNLCLAGVAPLGAAETPSNAQPRAQEAVAWYESAAEAEEEEGQEQAAADRASLGPRPHPDALYNLGQMLWEGVPPSVPADPPRAVACFNAAAALGDTSSLFFLGHLLRVGHAAAGVPVHPRRALKALEGAAAGGHGGAAHYLALFWREGDGGAGLPPSQPRALHFLQLAAELGHSEGCLDLAHSLARGEEGLPVDLPRALALYEQAAAGGGGGGEEESSVRVSALLAAGAMHFRGLGTPVSYSRAMAHYSAATEHNSIEAWECLASMHANGEGVPASESTARSILQLVKALRERAEKEAQRADAAAAAAAAAGAAEAEAAAATGSGQAAGGGGCGKSTCACKAK